MVLAIDIDNTLCNLQEVVVNLFNERYATHYTLNDFTEYDVMNVLPTEDAIKMKNMYGEIGIYNTVKPLPGAQNSLQKLINNGHQVYLVTDAIPATYSDKVEFFHRYFPFIDDAHIVSMKHKYLFRCDVLVEDNFANLIAKPYYHRICFNYPWNQSNKDYVYDIKRCYNWDDVVMMINEINELE
jgi:5'(3')-deoxyribonucleotidase